jgi:hypothetical protein
MSQEKYIGMDVHAATISVAVKNAEGKLLMECVLETKAATILEFMQGLRGTLALTFEEGTSATWLYDLLKPHVSRLVVCDARKNALLGWQPERSGGCTQLGELVKWSESLNEMLAQYTEQLRQHEYVPPATVLDVSVRYFQKILDRAQVCANPQCAVTPYFLATKSGQKFCSKPGSWLAKQEAKRKWWRENGNEWRRQKTKKARSRQTMTVFKRGRIYWYKFLFRGMAED